MEINSPTKVPKQVRLVEVRYKSGEPLFETMVLDDADVFDESERDRITMLGPSERRVIFTDAVAGYGVKVVTAQMPVVGAKGQAQ